MKVVFPVMQGRQTRQSLMNSTSYQNCAPASHAADAAAIAVELTLRSIIVEKTARQAEVCAEGLSTAATTCRDRLAIVAASAHHFSNFSPVHLVCFLGVSFFVVVLLVVTMPAPEDFTTARRHQLARPRIVRATHFPIFAEWLTARSSLRSSSCAPCTPCALPQSLERHARTRSALTQSPR